MRLSLIFVCIFCTIFTSGYGQNRVVQLSFIEVKSGVESNPNGIKVYNAETRALLASDTNRIELPIETNAIRIKINDPAYHAVDTVLNVSKLLQNRRKDPVLVIAVRFKGQFVQGYEVTSEYRPEVVFGTDSLHVEDFEVLADQKYILLTYPKRLQKSACLVLFVDDKATYSLDLRGSLNIKKLDRDYRGNVYLITEEAIFFIHIRFDALSIQQIDENYYYEHVVPIHDSVDHSLFVSNFSEWYPAFEYFGVDMLHNEHHELIKIQDDLMMEMYRAEYKWADVRTKLWAWDMERDTGVDREVWIGATQFTQSLYYEPLYAPLYIRNDSVLIFDHYKDSLFFFDGDFYNKIGAVHISYHINKKRDGWKKRLVQDPITANIFAVFEKAGFSSIGNVKVKSGELDQRNYIHYRYVEKIRIHNDYVYYTYRPFESTQKKYLYRERLSEMAEKSNGYN
jgi:hypothetical protein